LGDFQILKNVATQICTHECGFNAAYHLTRANGEQVGYSLSVFIHKRGAPHHPTFDGAAGHVRSSTRFKENVSRAEIKHHASAPRRPNENLAEGSIREVKKQWHQMMTKKNVPTRLWDCGMSWIYETGNLIANSSRHADQCAPLETTTLARRHRTSQNTSILASMIGSCAKPMVEHLESQFFNMHRISVH
jgi:hypothetical protein